ncbi:hypothetical protein MTR67_042715 [Solanum verrucosum]|uniref:SWIM-type domain-containing protein n=1 Tax=Solanum verrucosum TaxID=315347 RepID=A0AAF0UMX1_SOLVR|nr:hypothetical protein MTR67_042715 [Solanum verrucosum]
MDIIIVTRFHHGGKFVEGTSTYIGESEEEYVDDDSEINEELTTLRNERRTKLQRKKPVPTEEIILGVAGVDRGFEDIGRNKVDRDELDPKAVESVDLPARRKNKKVRFDPDCVVAIFELGMVFENAIEFRKAVAEYAVEYKVKLKLRPNEKHRVRVKCQHKKCKWLVYASLDKDYDDFIVKNYYHVHQCPTTTKNKWCTSNFIANKFRDRIVSQPYIKLWEIQELVRKKTGLYVERTFCYRAKLMILKEFMGDWKMEFARLCDYADMIKQTNPGSSCWERKSTNVSNCFTNFLIQDLNLGIGHRLTMMSDMQKIVSRGCMLDTSGPIGERRKQFWRCAKSSFEVKFQDEMDKLNKLGNKKNCGDLLHYEKKTWCKAYFKEHAKCDIVENNMCETFNSWILAARHKSVITMLEEIRHKIMDRNVEMRKFVDTWILDISPMASLVVEANKDYASDCQVRFNGQLGYEILDGHYRHIIDIRKKTCTCRTWQLRGIQCQHVVLAYQHAGQDLEDHVVHCDIVIEPPEPKQMSGRPPKCRRKSKDEPRKKYEKLSRRGVKMTCSKCHQQGHNNKACKYVPGSSTQPTSSSQPASSSQPQSSRQPTGYSQPLSSSQPVGSSQPPSSRQPTSFSQPPSSSQPPGTSGERVVTPIVFKCATPTNIDIGYKPRGLKWKGKDVVTTPQLQRMTLTPHRQNTFASEEVEIDKLDISFAVKKTNEEILISTVAATMVRCGEERDEK